MNLVPAIREMESAVNKIEYEHKQKLQELKDGLVALRKLNTVCEKCGGEGKYLRSHACAEDDRPDPNDLRDYIKCPDCYGTGKAKY